MLKVIKAASYIQIIKINKVAFKSKIIINTKKKKRMYKLLPKFIVPYSFLMYRLRFTSVDQLCVKSLSLRLF